MLKSIFVVILFFNMLVTVNAVANPLALFVEQCLQYQPNLGQNSFANFQSVEQQAVEFEKHTLALNNINDRVQYYRPFANDSQNQQGLLWCQLHLADELYTLTSSPNIQLLIEKTPFLSLPYNQFGKRLASIKQSQWSLIEKSKLHSAQASIHQALSQRQFTLHFNQQDCVLTNNSDTEHTNIKTSLAKYLIKQPQEHCRKQAWLAYQVRNKTKQIPALELIHQLKQKHAILQGYNNTAQEQLARYGLTPQQLQQFLTSQTTNLKIAPWNIAHALANTKKSPNINPLASRQFLQQALDSLASLGLTFEHITQKKTTIDTTSTDNTYIIRVWHQQRLLGEMFIDPQSKSQSNSNINAQLIKQTVIGHQFGQYALSFPVLLTHVEQQQKLINALSQAIVSLAQGGSFYFLTNKAQNPNAHAIATQWLMHYIQQQLNLPQMSERRRLAAQYQQQLWVFRAKVTLAFYQYSGKFDNAEQHNWLNHNLQLSSAFEQSFGQQWPNATDEIYSYQAIANEGISHYLPLWQTALTQLIIAETSTRLSTTEIFNVLVVNEKQLSLNDQLEQLIGLPTDPHSLIRRFKHAGTTQE
ncbi:hypothetical protein ACWXWU_03640 [Shewanella sp. A14]